MGGTSPKWVAGDRGLWSHAARDGLVGSGLRNRRLMHGRSGLVKGGIAVLAAAAAVLVAAPAANADDGAAQGKVAKEAGTRGFSVDFGEGQQPVTELFGLKLSDGSMLKMYCVEIDTG